MSQIEALNIDLQVNNIGSNESEALISHQNGKTSQKLSKNSFYSHNSCPTCKGSGKIAKSMHLNLYINTYLLI
jgi:hypothetical protein